MHAEIGLQPFDVGRGPVGRRQAPIRAGGSRRQRQEKIRGALHGRGGIPCRAAQKLMRRGGTQLVRRAVHDRQRLGAPRVRLRGKKAGVSRLGRTNEDGCLSRWDAGKCTRTLAMSTGWRRLDRPVSSHMMPPLRKLACTSMRWTFGET